MLINIIKVSLKVSFICHFDHNNDINFMITIWSETFDIIYNPWSDSMGYPKGGRICILVADLMGYSKGGRICILVADSMGYPKGGRICILVADLIQSEQRQHWNKDLNEKLQNYVLSWLIINVFYPILPLMIR